MAVSSFDHSLRVDCPSQVEPIQEAKEEETPLLLPSWARLDMSPAAREEDQEENC